MVLGNDESQPTVHETPTNYGSALPAIVGSAHHSVKTPKVRDALQFMFTCGLER